MDSENDLILNKLPEDAAEVPAFPSRPAYLRPAAPGVPSHPVYSEDRAQYRIPRSPKPASGVPAQPSAAGKGTVPSKITQRDIFTDPSVSAPKPPANAGSGAPAPLPPDQSRSRYVQRAPQSPQAPQRRVNSAEANRQRTVQGTPRNVQTSARNSYAAPQRATANGRDTKRRNPVAGFFASFLPWNGDTAKEGLRKIIMDFSALIVIACFVYFLNSYNDHRSQQMVRAEIQSMQEVADADAAALERQWLGVKAQYPDVDFPEGMNIRYASLYAKNPEFCGWINIPGTQIDYAVMHHPADDDPDNEEEDWYLHHDMEGNYSRYGEIYLDGSNSGATLDANNVIYGHNMTDGMLFAALEKYYTADGFAESPLIKYSTIYEDYVFKVYAAFITNGYSSGDNGYLFNYVNTHFPSEDNFMKFVEGLNERRLYDTGVDILPTDKLLTLSTCSYEISGGVMGRLAVIGRLVRPGETTTVNTSLVKKNPNPRYPQVWYDEHGMDNPYYDADRWTTNS